MTLIDNMPHRATIRVLLPVKTALGSRKLVSTVVATNLECWEQPASEAEILEFEKRGIHAVRKVYFPTDPNVKENNEILITSRDRGVTTVSSPPSLYVKSAAFPDCTAGLGAAFRVMCDDQTGGNE